MKKSPTLRTVIAVATAGALVLMASCGSGTPDATSNSADATAATSQSSESQDAGNQTSESATEESSPAPTSETSQSSEDEAEAPADARSLLPPETLDSNTLTVGVVKDYPPYNFVEPGETEVTGVSVDFAKVLGEVLGLNVEFKTITVATAIPDLQNGNLDTIITGLYDTEERRKQVDMIDYMQDGEVILVPKGNPLGIDKDSLCGHSISSAAGTSFFDKELPERSETCVKNGEDPIDMKQFPGAAAAVTATINGQVDSYINGSVAGQYTVTQTNGQLEVAGEPYNLNYVTVMMAKGSPLMPGLMAGFQQMIESGSYAQVLADWGLEKAAVECAILNSDESTCQK